MIGHRFEDCLKKSINLPVLAVLPIPKVDGITVTVLLYITLSYKSVTTAINQGIAYPWPFHNVCRIFESPVSNKNSFLMSSKRITTFQQ